MKQRSFGNLGLSASLVEHGAWMLAGGRKFAQVTENAKAGELNLEGADLARIRKDVIAHGEPAQTSRLV